MQSDITPETLLAFREHLAELRKLQGSFTSIEQEADYPKGYMSKFVNEDIKITERVKKRLLPALDKYGYSEWLSQQKNK